MARIGAFPEPIVGRIAGQVLRGLVYLHKDRHLLHRDLKPSNILINARGEVKISDFGVSGQLASSLASRGTWVGTVTYFSVRLGNTRLERFCKADDGQGGVAMLRCIAAM